MTLYGGGIMAKKTRKSSSKKNAGRSSAGARRTTEASPAAIDPMAIGVWVVLGLLVLAATFWTGYLVGKSTEMSPDLNTVGGGELSIVEYSDFQCPFCQRAVPTVKRLKQEYPNVDVVYKHFPLESIHPDAFNAAVAAECVRQNHGEDAFWTYHDTLFENQNDLGIPALKRYAQDQGADISACLDNQETADTVREHMAEGRQRGVSGTPSFWIGDELVVGAVPFEQLKATVDEKLAGGTPVRAPTQPQQQAPPQPAEERMDVEDGNYALGDEDAPVTIVEFTDFQCPFCQRAHQQTFPQIVQEYIETGNVRYTVRHFPLPFHQQAAKASEAAECAGKIGGDDAFFAYSDVLFDNQEALDIASLKSYAGEIGIDQAEFDSCLDSGEFSQLVQDDVNTGRELGVSGTPSFFVNGNKIVGAQPYSVFKAAIEAELE